MRALRTLSTAARGRSYIGSAPVVIPDGVSLALDVPHTDNRGYTPLVVTGPRGSVSVAVPPYARLDLDQADGLTKLEVSVVDEKEKAQRSMWGTLRSLIQNGVTGVSEGHLAILTFVGTGYRAELLSDKKISVKVGQSGLNVFDVPAGLSVLNPQPTQLVISGSDKCAVGQFAATIRALKPPEPYKGKGIFVNNETIKLKDKKAK